ncbi:MAG: class I SAM-dependent methyltransferase [Terracidiphilus sp.]|nr:class I SAM-dependent methyltransferase [Terracidiphilus sp.]
MKTKQPDVTQTHVAEHPSGVAYYKSSAAISLFANYGLSAEEAYLFAKYFNPGDSVLDLACGMGRTTLSLYEMGLKVRGLDYSDIFVEIANRRLPYLDIRPGSFTAITEPDASFNHVVISMCGIDCAYPETERINAFRECARVLKPGGTLYFSSHNLRSLHPFSPYYNYRSRIVWKLRNMLRGFNAKCYIHEGEEFLFYSKPGYTQRQVELTGLTLVESLGFGKFNSAHLDQYFSPYVHYVFRKPAHV